MAGDETVAEAEPASAVATAAAAAVAAGSPPTTRPPLAPLDKHSAGKRSEPGQQGGSASKRPCPARHLKYAPVAAADETAVAPALEAPGLASLHVLLETCETSKLWPAGVLEALVAGHSELASKVRQML